MDAFAFARAWIDDWNSHDIERVLAHYAEGAEFRSPIARQRTGEGVVHGLEALRAYWTPALALRPDLRFTLKQAFAGDGAVSINYADELGRDIVETLVLRGDGKAILGIACYRGLSEAD